MKKLLALLLGSLLASGCSFFGVRSGYEQPRYEIVDRLGESVEIRAYQPRLAAEATVESRDLKQGKSAAFRLLFDYISGANQSGASIAMTAPVETARSASEKIAMTVPVETAQSEDGRVYMRFFLPAEYSRESAPEPTDPRVRIVTVPAQTTAVLRFSGLGREQAVTAKTEELLETLGDTAWQTAAAPVAYYYDPPWTLPFFRRNEVVVAVVQ